MNITLYGRVFADVIKLRILRNFSGGPVVKSLPCKAGDTGSIPGHVTRILHAVGQLSPHTATAEPVHHNEDPKC